MTKAIIHENGYLLVFRRNEFRKALCPYYDGNGEGQYCEDTCICFQYDPDINPRTIRVCDNIEFDIDEAEKQQLEPGETWIDSKTNLEWQMEGPKEEMTWDDAMSYAESLGNGWRIPTIKELITLVDYGLINNVTVKHVPFQNIPSGYWSSTSLASSSDYAYAWCVYFGDGYVDYGNKSDSYYVRCVRDAA